MQENLISDAFNLLFYGMGFVFVFLVILVVATMLMSKIIMRFTPEPQAAPSKARPQNNSLADANLVAAISAAVHLHRNKSA